jgi:hypothetical protein
MEKEYGTVTYLNSIKDTFPYIESAIVVLDNNLRWWKNNYEVLEQQLANEIRGIADEPIKIRTRFTVYSGPDEAVQTVVWSGPAIEFTLLEASPMLVKKVQQKLGNNWNGHRVITDENKLIILFE